MLLLSGDVHSANTFKMPCSALTGYNVVEYCSSGMSHHARGFVIFLEDVMNMVNNPIYSPVNNMDDLNFGILRINTTSRRLEMEISNGEGDKFFVHQVDLRSDEWRFDPSKLKRNRELCVVVQRDQTFVNTLISIIRYYFFYPMKHGLWNSKSLRMYLSYQILFLAFSFCVSVILGALGVSLKCLYYLYASKLKKQK